MNSVMNTILFRGAMLVALLMGTANKSVAQADDSDVTVGDVSNTECANRTRSESVMGNPTLKLTRTENGLLGELNNYKANCAYGNVNVICQENGQRLTINVDEGLGDLYADCVCPINIYFTIFNALKEEYELTMSGKDVGTVSFKEHSVVEIDLLTLEQAYEEGFYYTVKAQGFWPYEITNNVKPDQDLSQSLCIYIYDNPQLNCVFRNYRLPLDYTYLDVQAGLDQEGTMVINVLTDGIPDKDRSKRVAHLFFDIVNVLNDNYHLRLNHIVSAGSMNECTVCLYEGDITLQKDNEVTIPINDNNNYKELIAGTVPLQIAGDGSAARYYDLQGRRVTAPQRKGVYVRDGKKMVVN